jgi:hypothetical protein
MTTLQLAWGASLVIMLWALTLGAVRTLAYRSEPRDHSRTMKTSAVFALAVGMLALLSFATLTVLLLT